MNLSQRDPPQAFTAAACAAPFPSIRPSAGPRAAAQAARVRSIRGTWERIAVDEKMEKNIVCVCTSSNFRHDKIFLELFEAQVIIDIPMTLLVVAGLSS